MMDKTISLQQAFDALHCRFADGFEEDRWWNSTHVIATLKGLPAVQPEIIRCNDCKRYIHHDKRCGYWNHGVKPDMWCSQAERREVTE